MTAARRGARVALLDAAENNRDLTRVVRRAAWRARVEADIYQWSEDGVLLALPEDGEGRAEDVAGMLRSLSAPGAEAFDLIICDGPHPDDSAVIAILERVDAVVALEDETDADTNSKCWSALARMGVRVAATVQFQEVEADEDEIGEEIAARRA